MLKNEVIYQNILAYYLQAKNYQNYKSYREELYQCRSVLIFMTVVTNNF